MKAKILYVEDDETLGFLTRDNLEQNNYEVDHFPDGRLGLEAFQKKGYDLCLLDVMLPEMDGYELAERIRLHNSDIPILFLTAKSMKEDRIHGLQLGADDYITKPFSVEELILKIEIFLKRKYVSTPDKDKYEIGMYTLDYKNLKLIYEDSENKLTQKEADLMKLLINNKDQTLRREDILKKLWGENDYFLGRSMDVFISRLRKYIKADPTISIENVHGVGFRLIEG